MSRNFRNYRYCVEHYMNVEGEDDTMVRKRFSTATDAASYIGCSRSSFFNIIEGKSPRYCLRDVATRESKPVFVRIDPTEIINDAATQQETS